MNSSSSRDNKIKRRSFFYYIGAASLGGFILSLFPFNLILRKSGQAPRSSIQVKENPLAVKRGAKGSFNG